MKVRLHIGDCFEKLEDVFCAYDLVIADPPYGGILKSKTWNDVANYHRLGLLLEQILVPGATAYVWGGIGRPGDRPFFTWLSRVENETCLTVHDVITWRKRRAYGCKDRLLFVREECAMLTMGEKPNTFHIPYLETKRGYEGFDPKHPAKSEFLRRTNVWDDITELFRGKIHDAEKPPKLAEVMIRTSANPGDRILDPFAGSCSSALGLFESGVDADLDLIELTKCEKRIHNAEVW